MMEPTAAEAGAHLPSALAEALPRESAGAVDQSVSSRERTIQRRETTFRRLLGAADALAIALALLIDAVILGGNGLSLPTLLVPPLFILVAKAMGLYERDAHLLHKSTLDEVPKLFGLATLSALLLWLSGDLLVNGSVGRTQVVAIWGLLILLLVGLRTMARRIARAVTFPERCLFVGDPEDAEELRGKLATSGGVKAELVGWLPTNGDGSVETVLPERIRALTDRQEIHRVILGPGPGRSEELLDEIRQIRSEGLRVSVLPEFSRVVSSAVVLDRLNDITLLGVRRFQITRSSRILKRAFDLTGSAFALAILSPLLAGIAVAVKLDSPGPVLFRQRRAGRDGAPFQMLKFRSMVKGADEQKDSLRHLNEADGVFKIAHDPRVTRVGRWMRRLHVDELPQLVNVLRGEMSLVGPRPLPLDEDEQIVGWHRRRLDLRPGITGPWQILGSSRIPIGEMVKLDYQYVADWSLWNDVRILLLTVPTVLGRQGL
jgi:exopolysaccharide biosynthesis polyprenyl glycosylphosphotransferase